MLTLVFHKGQNYQVLAESIADIVALLPRGFTVETETRETSDRRALNAAQLQAADQAMRQVHEYEVGARQRTFAGSYLLYQGQLAGVISVPTVNNPRSAFGQYAIGLQWEHGGCTRALPAVALKLIALVRGQ